MTSANSTEAGRMRGIDYFLLLVVCAGLYGVAAFSGRPLSVHEARLPQLAREMAQGQSDWLLPQSAGRPWLERPPLPHWCTAFSILAFNRNDALWVVRLAAAIAGCAIVLTGAWMAARWFGRSLGLLAGVVIATSYELYQYATLAEDDIYLGALAAACVALFVAAEWSGADSSAQFDGAPPDRRIGWRGWVGDFLMPRRDWATVGFFVLLGLTNLAKGPLVGAVPIIAAVGLYLLCNREARSLRRCTWLWGWLIFLALTAVWPWWAHRHYPDVWDNWRFDYLGKSDGNAAKQWNEPWWYYLMMLPMALAPWTWATVIGAVASARRAWNESRSPERFVWCWALAGLIVLSLPARKHHHYLVPIVTPWAILGALGLREVGKWIDSRGSRRASDAAAPRVDPRPWLLAAAVAAFIACAAWVQFAVAGRDPAMLAEMTFLAEVEAGVPPGEPVFINSDIGSLGFFRLQFTLHRWQRLLHNLSFLRDRELRSPVAYVITRAHDEPALSRIGATGIVAQAATSRRERSPGQRFTLFRVMIPPELQRYPRPAYIGVMQAMGRKPGPWCGDDSNDPSRYDRTAGHLYDLSHDGSLRRPGTP